MSVQDKKKKEPFFTSQNYKDNINVKVKEELI